MQLSITRGRTSPFSNSFLFVVLNWQGSTFAALALRLVVFPQSHNLIDLILPDKPASEKVVLVSKPY